MRILHFIERSILFVILSAVPLVVYYGVIDPNIVKSLIFRSLLLMWCIVFLVKLIWTRSLTFTATNLAFGVVLWLLLSTFSMVFSDYKTAGIDSLELLVCFIFFFFLLGQIFSNRNEVLSALQAVTFGALLVSMYGILQAFGIDFSNRQDLSRVFSTFGHPNFLASYLVCTIPLTAGLFLGSHAKWKYYYGASIALQSICLFLTLSRGAFISAIVAFVFFAICYFKIIKGKETVALNRRIWCWIFLALLTFSIVSIAIVQNLHKSQVNRLTEMFSTSTDNTFWLRWLQWKGSIELIKKAPFLGNGIGTFSIGFPPNQPREFSRISTQRNEFLRHAHNEYLELWCEMGVFGPIVLLFVLVSAIHAGIRLIKFQNGEVPAFWILGILSGLFGLGFNMLFSVSFRFMVTPLIFWFYLGIIHGLMQNRLAKKRVQHLNGKIYVAFISFLIIGVIFLSFSTVKSTALFKSERDFFRGLKSLKSGELNEALKHMERALQNNPKKPEIHYKKGALLVQLENWPDALRTYLTLRKLNPYFFHINYNLSLCYLNLGDFGNAVAFGELESILYPDFAKQYLILGEAYYKSNNYQKARKYFEKYLSLDPKNVIALVYLGNIHYFKRELEAAIGRYKQVLQIQPQNIVVRANLFEAYMETSDFDKALDIFCVSLEIDYSTSSFENKQEIFKLMVEKLRTEFDDSSILKSCPGFSEYVKASSISTKLQKRQTANVYPE